MNKYQLFKQILRRNNHVTMKLGAKQTILVKIHLY